MPSATADAGPGVIGRVHVIRGPDQGLSFPIEAGSVVVLGRGADSTIRLNDPHISRRHCELREVDGGLRLADLGSTTGTKVKRQTISQHALKDGDTFVIGKTQLRVELGDGPRPTPGAPGVITVGTLLGGLFEVGPLLAQGQTGIVHRGMDRRDGKPVALKFLHGEATDTEEQVERFVRAMKTVVSLRHPNLVAVHGAGRSGSRYWLAMEYVPGESLNRVIDRIGTANMLDWRITLRIAYHIARALEAAHERQIVHRNISPRNILIRKGDEVAKLGDLMLAKATDGLQVQSLTRPGQLVGTIAYMAPERTASEKGADTRADLYALGATIYALLTGRPPFEGKTLADTLRQIRTAEPIPPKKYHLAVPDLLQGSVLKLLAKRPDDRYDTPSDLIGELQRVALYHNLRLE